MRRITSELMRSALRLLEQQENLKQAIDAGLASGVSLYSLRELAEQVKNV